ncbi:MAG: S26 family signal peptidase [Deltaproteobacteria bacterium]|nr:S26 family signal peptidase [Deltaproteobacteria bacterium]
MRRSNPLEGRKRRGNRLLAWAVALTLVWLALASRVHVNASWSDGAWGYLMLPLPGAPGRGESVVFEPLEAVGSPVPYLKTVHGLPGDRVEVDGNRRVRVNGKVLGIAKTHARDGRPLKITRPGVIPPDRYYVHADHADSHDSRYAEIGLVAREQILGRALALPDIPWLGLEGSLAGRGEEQP